MKNKTSDNSVERIAKSIESDGPYNMQDALWAIAHQLEKVAKTLESIDAMLAKLMKVKGY